MGACSALRFEPDSDASVNDYDQTEGRMDAPDRRARLWVRAQRAARSGFHRRSRRSFTRDYHEQPLVGALRRLEQPNEAENAPKSRDICDLVRYGFKGVILELCNGTDAYGLPIVEQRGQLVGGRVGRDAWPTLARSSATLQASSP